MKWHLYEVLLLYVKKQITQSLTCYIKLYIKETLFDAFIQKLSGERGEGESVEESFFFREKGGGLWTIFSIFTM